MGYAYRDPSGAARAALWAIWAFLAAKLLWLTISLLSADGNGRFPPEVVFFAWAPLAGYLISSIFVLRWIYRTNANAHAFGAPMEITPGWAVGWFFVPIAAFVMPYRGLVQTWRGTVSPRSPDEVRAPSALLLWWTLWLTHSGLGSIASVARRLGSHVAADPIFAGIVTVEDAALVVVFAQIIQDLTQLQRRREQADVFA